jgi:LysM repeat protein
MNTQSPLVPQGTQPPRGKSSLYFKVLMVLTVHVVLIGGMLLQGCKDTSKADANKDSSITSTTDTAPPATAPTAPDNSVAPVTSATTLSNQTMSAIPPTAQPAQVSEVPPVSVLPGPTAVSAPAMNGGEYVIAQGDTMGAIAKRNSVSLRALMEANPGVNPKKLQIGHKLQIPTAGGPTIAATSAAPGVGAGPLDATTAGASDSPSYTVKSGDTLGRIARAHGTSYKKIMALNDLKTTAIRVGQKLKMPAPKPAGAEIIPAAASISPAAPAGPGAPTASVAN